MYDKIHYKKKKNNNSGEEKKNQYINAMKKNNHGVLCFILTKLFNTTFKNIKWTEILSSTKYKSKSI